MNNISITNPNLISLYNIINELNETHPLWWQDFIENIVNNKQITFINNTTLIFGLYELEVNELVILYNILKKFKKGKLLTKVINKREFLIVHINDETIMEYLIDQNKWLNLILYKNLNEIYGANCLILNPTNEETLRFVHQGIVFHFFTNPTKIYKSNKYHKYIYLYYNLHIKHLNLLDNQLKYLRNKQEFNKKLNLILEKNIS
jgi:hypothetical protein